MLELRERKETVVIKRTLGKWNSKKRFNRIEKKYQRIEWKDARARKEAIELEEITGKK